MIVLICFLVTPRSILLSASDMPSSLIHPYLFLWLCLVWVVFMWCVSWQWAWSPLACQYLAGCHMTESKYQVPRLFTKRHLLDWRKSVLGPVRYKCVEWGTNLPFQEVTLARGMYIGYNSHVISFDVVEGKALRTSRPVVVILCYPLSFNDILNGIYGWMSCSEVLKRGFWEERLTSVAFVSRFRSNVSRTLVNVSSK